MGVHCKIRFFGGMGGEGVNCQKKRAWIVCRFKNGLGKRRGYVFEVGGWDSNADYEFEEPSYWHKYSKQITL